MFNYNGCTCDVCGETFTSESDVVVCPDCGTPHHRACFKQMGHCANQEQHDQGFEWKAPEKEVDFNANICPRCQAENPKDVRFCESCGTAITQNVASSASTPIGEIINRGQAIPTSPILPKALEGETEGVSYRDIAIYVGPGAPYYVFKFKRKEKEGKRYKPFCWSAFLFDGFYFLYRKMWKESLIVLIVSLILSYPSMIMLYSTAGLLAADSPLLLGNLESLMPLFSVLMFAFKLFLGFWAVPAYKKKVVKDLKQLKSQCSSQNEYYQTVVKRSGPSRAVLIIGLIMVLFTLFF